MVRFFHDLALGWADAASDLPALAADRHRCCYGELARQLRLAANGFHGVGLKRSERVAIYLDKRIETVVTMLAASAAGAIFVPCNPVLKPLQVAHILRDSGARLLVTSRSRLAGLLPYIDTLALSTVILIDSPPPEQHGEITLLDWADLLAAADETELAGPRTDGETAAIFYTSGSTGMPKGVVLSHRNLVVGGESVSEYLGNSREDRLLALLPLSFDAGFSQLTTGFYAGALVVLHNYLLARDVPKVCARERITGLTCVPPLWIQCLEADWPEEARRHMRYVANTGGRMPREILTRLRALFPSATPYLMYGLTEAFRSSYLDPAEIDRRPDSIGKAIPNAEILVVKPDGSLAGPGEQGELVHCGPLVSKGYWNDPERTARRFKPAPGRPAELPIPEMAVYSGDIVRLDDEGFLYFVGRNDDMIKTSGYRVSPAEVEEAAFDSGLVKEAAALGLAHPSLGQEIVLVVVPAAGEGFDGERLRAHCLEVLPRYMVPGRILVYESLPRSPNGKIDRRLLAASLEKDGMDSPR